METIIVRIKIFYWSLAFFGASVNMAVENSQLSFKKKFVFASKRALTVINKHVLI